MRKTTAAQRQAERSRYYPIKGQYMSIVPGPAGISANTKRHSLYHLCGGDRKVAALHLCDRALLHSRYLLLEATATAVVLCLGKSKNAQPTTSRATRPTVATTY